VRVSGASWSGGFPYIAGYGVPTGAAQLAPLPWFNANKIFISFSEDVSIQQSDLSLEGVNVPSYAFSDFSYDSASRTAAWTLTAPISRDKLRLRLADGVR